jgi:hypothetical protein
MRMSRRVSDLPSKSQSKGALTFKKLPKEDPTPFGVGFAGFTVKIAAKLSR